MLLYFSVGTAPEMLRKLKPVKCLTGDKVEFSCELDLGNPISEVTWERQKRTIRQNDRVEISVSGNKHQLTIKNCTLDDIGVYTVRASNKLGTVESEADLHISSKWMLIVFVWLESVIYLLKYWVDPSRFICAAFS